jgi:hypothetical protein
MSTSSSVIRNHYKADADLFLVGETKIGMSLRGVKATKQSQANGGCKVMELKKSFDGKSFSLRMM